VSSRLVIGSSNLNHCKSRTQSLPSHRRLGVLHMNGNKNRTTPSYQVQYIHVPARRGWIYSIIYSLIRVPSDLLSAGRHVLRHTPVRLQPRLTHQERTLYFSSTVAEFCRVYLHKRKELQGHGTSHRPRVIFEFILILDQFSHTE